MRSFFSELKRRNVLRAAALYIGAAWALSQAMAQLLPVFDVPNWMTRWFVIAVIIGFPFAMLFSWFYKWTSQGLQNTGSFNVQVRQPSDSVLLFGGTKITATATDSLGNTSEFSACTTYDDNGVFGNGFDPPPMWALRRPAP
jgi:hypothetical protein